MKTSLQKNPITYFNTPQNIGGYSSVRAKYSCEIIQQFDSSSIVNDQGIQHLTNEDFLFDFSTQHSFVNYLFQQVLTEFSLSKRLTFSVIVESILTREDFFEFWAKEVDGSRFCVELVDMNNYTIVLNPLYITYSYQGSASYTDSNRYELTFSRAKQVDYSLKDLKLIDFISSRTFNYAGTTANEATINLFGNISQLLFDFGYSIIDNIDKIIYQNTPASNIIHNLADGTYYFFAVNRQLPEFYDRVKATLTAGQIQIIVSELDNPQIVTENETSTDEGTLVSD